jgi:hypothetical protein
MPLSFLRMYNRGSDWPLFFLVQDRQLSSGTGLYFVLASTLEDLYIYEARYSQPDWQDDIENVL